MKCMYALNIARSPTSIITGHIFRQTILVVANQFILASVTKAGSESFFARTEQHEIGLVLDNNANLDNSPLLSYPCFASQVSLCNNYTFQSHFAYTFERFFSNVIKEEQFNFATPLLWVCAASCQSFSIGLDVQ